MRRKKPPVFGPDGQPVCGCKTRRGTPCQGLRMPNGRCRMHGGTATITHAGPMNPNWRGGISKPRYDGPAIHAEFQAVVVGAISGTGTVH